MKKKEIARKALEDLIEKKIGSTNNHDEEESEDDNIDSADEEESEEDNTLDSEDELRDNIDELKKPVKRNRHVEELKKVLGLESSKFGTLAGSEMKEEIDSAPSVLFTRVETKASKVLGKRRPPPEVVCYKSEQRKDDSVVVNTKQKGKKFEKEIKDINEQPVFSMRKARQEVLRFGITGFDKATQRAANVALAIKLGARPPKNEYKNYKLYKEQQREHLERKRQQDELNKKLGLTVKKSQKKKDKKEIGTGSLGLKMGKFDGGILKISSKELKNVKRKKK